MDPLLIIDATATRRTDSFPTDLIARSSSSLALLGQWHALFQALSGEIQVGKDSIRVAGADSRHQVISGTLGLALSRFEWPQGHSVASLLELSAGLLGMGAREATAEMERVLQALQLTALRQQKLAKLLPLQSRLVGLAHALLGSPKHLAVEDAMLGLTTQDGMAYLKALAVAREGRTLIVNVAHAAPGSVERLLVDGCEEVVVFSQGTVTVQGPPERLNLQQGLFRLTVAGTGAAQGGHAVRSALEQRGVVVLSCTSLPSANGVSPGPLARLVVKLDPGAATLPLFAAAKSCNSTLLDLHALPNLE